MTTLTAHQALYHALNAQYGTEWPREAILRISHSFALLYGELPREYDFRHDWHMPSKHLTEKIYTWSAFHADLLAAYPYLRELRTWGVDVCRPLVTVTCLTCSKPYQTRNPAKWHLHPRCRRQEGSDEDASWMNCIPVGDVRDYNDLHELAQAATQPQRRKWR